MKIKYKTTQFRVPPQSVTCSVQFKRSDASETFHYESIKTGIIITKTPLPRSYNLLYENTLEIQL